VLFHVFIFSSVKIETAQNLVLGVCQDFQMFIASGCKRLMTPVKDPRFQFFAWL
jgi:hypothetical protein